jgi:hypothetical protein
LSAACEPRSQPVLGIRVCTSGASRRQPTAPSDVRGAISPSEKAGAPAGATGYTSGSSFTRGTAATSAASNGDRVRASLTTTSGRNSAIDAASARAVSARVGWRPGAAPLMI